MQIGQYLAQIWTISLLLDLPCNNSETSRMQIGRR